MVRLSWLFSGCVNIVCVRLKRFLVLSILIRSVSGRFVVRCVLNLNV